MSNNDTQFYRLILMFWCTTKSISSEHRASHLHLCFSGCIVLSCLCLKSKAEINSNNSRVPLNDTNNSIYLISKSASSEKKCIWNSVSAPAGVSWSLNVFLAAQMTGWSHGVIMLFLRRERETLEWNETESVGKSHTEYRSRLFPPTTAPSERIRDAVCCEI